MSQASCFLTPTNQLKMSRDGFSQSPTTFQTQAKIQSLFTTLTKINHIPQTKSELYQEIKQNSNRVKQYKVQCQVMLKSLKKQLNEIQIMIEEQVNQQKKKPKNSNKGKNSLKKISKYQQQELIQKIENFNEKDCILERINELFSMQSTFLKEQQRNLGDIAVNLNKRMMNQKIMIAEKQASEKFQINNIEQETQKNLRYLDKKFINQTQKIDSIINNNKNSSISLMSQIKPYTDIKKKFSKFRSDLKISKAQIQVQEHKIRKNFEIFKKQINKHLDKQQKNQQESFDNHYKALEKMFSLVQKNLKNK